MRLSHLNHPGQADENLLTVPKFWFYIDNGKLIKYKVVFIQLLDNNTFYLRTECGYSFCTGPFSPCKTIEQAWRNYINELKDALTYQSKELKQTRKEIRCIKKELNRIGASM